MTQHLDLEATDNWRINQLLDEHLFDKTTYHHKARAWLYDFAGTGDGMLMVVEAMRAKGYHYVLRDYVDRNEALFQREGENCAASAFAEKLSRAVALAALAGLGVEVPAEVRP